jgi:hypothetical protein
MINRNNNTLFIVCNGTFGEYLRGVLVDVFDMSGVVDTKLAPD